MFAISLAMSTRRSPSTPRRSALNSRCIRRRASRVCREGIYSCCSTDPVPAGPDKPCRMVNSDSWWLEPHPDRSGRPGSHRGETEEHGRGVPQRDGDRQLRQTYTDRGSVRQSDRAVPALLNAIVVANLIITLVRQVFLLVKTFRREGQPDRHF